MSLEYVYQQLILASGDHPTREGLQGTPQRASQAFSFLTEGYRETLESCTNNALFSHEGKGLILVKHIKIFSLCEHHLLPFFGVCHVGYLPNGKILGVSKVSRIVNMYARRLQIQERLTQEIAGAIEEVTQAAGVAVMIEAHHLCMMMRGVEAHDTTLHTSHFLGAIEQDPILQTQFLSAIQNPSGFLYPH